MQEHLANWLIRRYQQAIRQKPDQPKAWSKLYTICTQESKSGEFVQFCEDVIKLHAGNHHAWTFLQLSAKDDAHPIDILTFSKEIVRLHPEEKRSHQF